MSKWDKEYLKLCKRILEDGKEVENRTGINTIKVPSHHFHFDFEEEFPVLTTKQLFFRQAILEMLWIYQVQSNDVRWLQERNVHIWDEWEIDENGIWTAEQMILNNQNELEKQIIKKARKNHIKYQNINNATLKISNIKFQFLASQKSSNENDDSLIIYTKIGKQNILLMGDAEKQREKYILNTYNLNKVDILKVGHHGSNTSTSPELIKQVRPIISLISAGKNNLYGHPHKETLEKLKDSKILITQIDGSVKINLNTRAIYTMAR